MTRNLVRSSIVALVASATYWACGSDGTTEPPQTPPPEPKPTRAVAVSGDGQTGTVGQQLGAPLVLQINDQSGNPMSGVSVSFTVSQGGGTVSSASGTTGANGQASTEWTLGTTSGSNHQVTAAAASASGVTATFNATAVPDAAIVISAVSGGGQFTFRGTKVPEPIVVKVRDQFANPVPGHLVEFVVTGGTGALDSAVAFTDVGGEARTGWTVSATVRTDTAEARAAGLTGSPVIFTASAHNVSVTSVVPNPLVLGQSATIMGTGFDATPGNNAVTIGGEAAAVTAATPTQLDITVPASCTPAGSVAVQVTVGGIPSAPASANRAPASFLSMSPGEQIIIQDPSDFCLQFDESTGQETYLIGIQSVTEAASSRTPVMVTSVSAAGAAPAPPVVGLAPPARARVALDPKTARRLERWQRHREAEARLLERELEAYRARPRSIPRAPGPSRIPPDLKVGDMLDIRVPDESATCDDFTTITTIVRVVGSRAVWLEDVANPSGGFSTSDFQSFSDLYDDPIYDTDVSYFGEPGDIDGNGLVAAVITKEVNRRSGVAGFVSPRDVMDVNDCATSNESELFYVWAPDPSGDFGDALDLDFARDVMPIITAHETVHIIQIGRRSAAMAPSLQTLWELEGQATLGEEVVEHARRGNTVAQNYPNSVAFDLGGPELKYIAVFADLFFYYGADYTIDLPNKLSGAPEDCTWIARGVDQVCLGSLINGVPWSFLRWISDQFGPSFTGGEQGLQQALIDNSTMTGFANVADVVGQPIETLLGQWAAMLYTDDRILSDGTQVIPDPALTMTSWSMYSVFEETSINGSDVHVLRPAERGFQSFADNINVRAVSTGYFIVSGAGRAATAIRARDGSDQALPSFMQLWIVRMR